MGDCMTLPLYGTASRSAGFGPGKTRSIVRLRSVDSCDERLPSDFALVKTPDQFGAAVEANWRAIFVVQR